jgi:hypothetical protein
MQGQMQDTTGRDVWQGLWWEISILVSCTVDLYGICLSFGAVLLGTRHINLSFPLP